MNILFDINHPAHFHLFKNFIRYLKESGHKVIISAREKDITTRLLEHSGLEYTVLSRARKGLLGMAREQLERDIGIFRLHRNHRFDLAFGTSTSIGHLSLFSKVKSYCFAEDDDRQIPFFVLMAYPFSTRIINPEGLKYSWFKKKRVLHNSLQKLAYLHPDNFTPDEAVVRNYGLEPHKYIIFRKSALGAHHDRGIKGVSADVWSELEELIKDHPLIISREGHRSHSIEPCDMHHILHYAKLLISDSQSMSVEAAVLGVPSIRYSSFAGRLSVLEELEQKYGLTYGFDPADRGSSSALKEKLTELLQEKDLRAIWQKKKAGLLKDKCDLTRWLIDYFEAEIRDQQ